MRRHTKIELAFIKVLNQLPSTNLKSRSTAFAQTHKSYTLLNTSTSVSATKLVTVSYRQLSVKYNLLRRNYEALCASNAMSVQRILKDSPSHLVAVFKEYLIYDDTFELLERFYLRMRAGFRFEELARYHGKTKPLCFRKGLAQYQKKKQGNFNKRGAYYFNKNSALFDSGFMESLVKDDFKESRSHLPLDSLFGPPVSENSLPELLEKLGEAASTKNKLERHALNKRETPTCVVTIDNSILPTNMQGRKIGFRRIAASRPSKPHPDDTPNNSSSEDDNARCKSEAKQRENIPCVRICLTSEMLNVKAPLLHGARKSVPLCGEVRSKKTARAAKVTVTVLKRSKVKSAK
eukprot:TRINITY_DN16191_c0_g1_i4.p1 TRINITY_DN16191_c0_g1~~TRINITY_DN16191_c0_g1_i4.p1  ORF type:complete len:349 (+),score=53.76 TRINITY_DN16191_c0_g1_i4:128-1174(+)